VSLVSSPLLDVASSLDHGQTYSDDEKDDNRHGVSEYSDYAFGASHRVGYRPRTYRV
jgi:hypothetical protein